MALLLQCRDRPILRAIQAACFFARFFFSRSRFILKVSAWIASGDTVNTFLTALSKRSHSVSPGTGGAGCGFIWSYCNAGNHRLSLRANIKPPPIPKINTNSPAIPPQYGLLLSRHPGHWCVMLQMKPRFGERLVSRYH